jgi:hypothetical protein
MSLHKALATEGGVSLESMSTPVGTNPEKMVSSTDSDNSAKRNGGKLYVFSHPSF